MMLQKIKSNIPNAITSMNLFSGAMACVAAFHGQEQLVGSLTGTQTAFLFIALSAVFDFFDGFAARLLHVVSGIGKELDSLSDSVSFGLAPALILLNVMQQNGVTGVLPFVALIIPVFGALRLAKFNLDTNQGEVFTGLPIPANAIFWIGFADYYVAHPELNVWVVVALVVALSVLMVCSLRLFSLKVHGIGLRTSYRQWLILVAAVILVLTMGLPGLSCVIAAYVVLSVVTRVK